MMHVSQSIGQQVSQPVSLSQFINPVSLSQSISPVSLSQSISPVSLSQSISPVSLSQSVNQSVSLSVSQSVSQSVSKSNNQPVRKVKIQTTVEFRFSMVGIWLVWQSVNHQFASKSTSHAISHEQFWHFSHNQTIGMCALILKFIYTEAPKPCSPYLL